MRKRRSYKVVTRAGTLILCALLLYVAVGCRTRDVRIVGNYHESEEEVKELLGTGPLSGNSVLLYLLNRHRKIGGNTFVDKITVDLESPTSVTVNVSEKMLIGCVEYDAKYWYFDRTGIVLVCKDSFGSSGNSDGTALLSQVRDEYEMAGSSQMQIKNWFTALLADPVLYGEEFEAGGEEAVSAEGGEDEIVIGASSDGEAGLAPEEDDYEEGYPEDEINQGDDAFASSELTEYGEPLDEDSGSEGSSGEEGSFVEENPEDADGEAADNVIEPVIVTEETGDAAFENADPGQSETLDTSEKGRNYIPLVRGMVFSEAVLGYPLPVQFENAFTSLAVLKSFIDRSGYVPDEVLFDADGDLIVTYGEAAVNLGKGENIKQRVTVIGEALPSFAGLRGVLHLENYDGTRNRLIFSKNEKNS